MSPLGFGYDDEEDDEQPRAKIARPQPDATPPLALRGVNTGSTDEMTANADKTRSLNSSALSETMQPSSLAQRRGQDEAEAQRLQSTGSGISQIKNPYARNALRAVSAIGSAILPRTMGRIPGTEEHHNQLLGTARQNIAGDIEEQGKEATAAETGARTDLARAQTAKAEQDTALAGQPKPKEEEWSIVPGMIGPNGQPVQQEKNSGQIRFAPDVQGVGPLKEPSEGDKEKDINDYLSAQGLPNTPQNREKARVAIANRGKQEPGNFMPLYDEKGHVTGAWDPKSGRVVRTPQEGLPGTTTGGAGISSKADAAATKAAAPYQAMIDNANEAHELADMATKGNASADVDLVLNFFKMMRGTGGGGVRFTQQEQNLILGARNAGQGLLAIGQKVMGGGQPLTPEQRQNMVNVIDMHAKAAQQALERLKQPSPGGETPPTSKDFGAAPQGKGEGATGTMPDGTKVVVKGGRLVAQ